MYFPEAVFTGRGSSEPDASGTKLENHNLANQVPEAKML